MAENQLEIIWVVVKVESGIPVMVEAYHDGQSAELRNQFLRLNMHPENDETGVFEIQIGHCTFPEFDGPWPNEQAKEL
jgi:hypothetical protein